MKKIICVFTVSLIGFGCSTINVNVAPPTTAADGTNSVASVDASLTATNAVSRTVASGSVIVVINMNAAKDIKPDTTATLTK